MVYIEADPAPRWRNAKEKEEEEIDVTVAHFYY